MATVQHRGRGRNHEPRHRAARPRTRAVGRGVRGAVGTPGRFPLRREPEPPADAHPVPGDPEAGAGRPAGALPRLARGPRHRSFRPRRALRRGQLAAARHRRVGPRVGGLARRHGDHPVHLLPTGGWPEPRPHPGRAHLRRRTHPDGTAGRDALQGHRLLHRLGRAPRHVRRGLRPAGVRDEPLLPRRRRRRGQPSPLRDLRRRGHPHGRGPPPRARARLHPEVEPRVQRHGRPRRDLHHRARQGVRDDAPPHARHRRPVDRAPRGTRLPPDARRDAGRGWDAG